jgi:hypothetical protein
VGTGITGSAASNLATLNPLSGFEWAGNLPTFGGSPTVVSPANVVGAQNAANQANLGRFAAANTLNNTLFNGVGTLGGAALSGNGGLSGLLSGFFGGGGTAADFGGGGAALGVADQLGLQAAPLAADAGGGGFLSGLGSLLGFL